MKGKKEKVCSLCQFCGRTGANKGYECECSAIAIAGKIKLECVLCGKRIELVKRGDDHFKRYLRQGNFCEAFCSQKKKKKIRVVGPRLFKAKRNG